MNDNQRNKQHIAIIGTRGIPANYGGFETFAEELSTRLVVKGYRVTVYCRVGNAQSKDLAYKGVTLVTLPTIKHKYFDTIAHTFLSMIHVCFTDVKIVYVCNAINAAFLWIPRLFGKKVVINVDGLEWKRKKWNQVGKKAYQISEKIATLCAHYVLSDSKGIQQYYRERYKKETIFIPYGAYVGTSVAPGDVLRKWGLKPRQYILYVSRFEPENNAHIVIKAYEQVKSDMPLVMVGGAPYSTQYIQDLKSTKDPRVKFVGFQYGAACNELRCNAYLYIHGNEVGGTNPALLEAMATGNCCIVNGVSFNQEVVGDAGCSFEPDNSQDLKKQIEYLMAHPAIVDSCREKAIQRIKKYYNWDDIIVQYDEFFKRITR